ncbi:Cation efflux protein [Carpediemonas membranifera]|uniref:Cation efflux protein n=1 Tax=Carpediemonas membranifera TaxID=201153 RepID=A0A8J6AYD6_9EUKA|nr:Cation efflux protein [Carpediemonas membranifera]|eukprot:KAG9390274.1 Cation efflux protein [Carpediemonas membranifera]
MPSKHRDLIHGLKAICSNKDTRKVLLFLVLNLLFMFVELFFGLLRGSLSLVSDAFHMFFDCTSLFLSMMAMFMSSKPPNARFSYGFGRIEVLAAYGNSLFLVCVASMLVVKAVARLLQPVAVSTDQLLLVAVLGLLVNLLGLVMIDADETDTESRKANIRGIFLHVLADSLGSVGVIASCILIRWRNWVWTDPVASLAIAGLLSHAVLPLLRSSYHVLSLHTPGGASRSFRQQLDSLPFTVPGVHTVVAAQIWPMEAGDAVGWVRLRGAGPDVMYAVKEELASSVREDRIIVEVAT